MAAAIFPTSQHAVSVPSLETFSLFSDSGDHSHSSIMTFKCHKKERAGEIYLYPCNSIGFHPTSTRFVYTVGGDGVVNFWDFIKKDIFKSHEL